MPLPALPANLVQRYKLRYQVQGNQHSITVHMSTTGTSSDAGTNGTALANLLKTILPSNGSFVGVDFAAAGSNVFNPVVTLSIAGTGAAASGTINTPRAASFVGRNANGRKIRLFIIGVDLAADTNWRVEIAEDTRVSAIVTGLNAGTGDVRCIDGVAPLWRAYVNIKYMDHWVKAQRKLAG
jgi:hypothetical protein